MSFDRVLITGGGGQLASDLGELLSGSTEIDARTREQLDIAEPEQLRGAFGEAPDVVFNCAAFHNFGECESDPARALEVNVRAVRDLAQHCADSGARLVHLSTNYVFDGSSPEPYAETDLPNPGSVYAISKLAGEFAALAYAPGALVVRAAGLYGLTGSASKGGNFVMRMLERARQGEPLAVVADQRLSPTFTADLAGGLLAAVEAGAAGVLHLTAAGGCSWHEFTEEIMRLAGEEVEVRATETEQAGGPQRPLNGVLENRAAADLGLDELRDWRQGLADYMARAGLTAESSPAPSS